MILVAILDDNRLVRDGLSAMLAKLPDIRVVASMAAPSPSLAATPVHVLLLDVGLLDHESLRVAIALRDEMPDTKIIVMDLIPVQEEIMEFVNAGVSGFVLKDATFDEFVATIRSVAAGQKVLPPLMTESLFSQIVAGSRGIARHPRRTATCSRCGVFQRSLGEQPVILVALTDEDRDRDRALLERHSQRPGVGWLSGSVTANVVP